MSLTGIPKIQIDKTTMKFIQYSPKSNFIEFLSKICEFFNYDNFYAITSPYIYKTNKEVNLISLNYENSILAL